MVSPAPVSPARILGSAGLFALLSSCFPDPLPVDTDSDTGASSTTGHTRTSRSVARSTSADAVVTAARIA